MILIALGVAACASEPDDPQGTYRITISPPVQQGTVPTTVSWPDGGELTLRFDAGGQARVTMFGHPVAVASQEIVTDPRRYVKPVELGSLELAVNTDLQLASVDDLVACPHTGRFYGDFFELYFFDGHVEANAGEAIVCDLRPSFPTAILAFQLSGDRISD